MLTLRRICTCWLGASLLLLGCGSGDDADALNPAQQDEYEQDSDLLLDGKNDSTTAKVVVKGQALWGEKVSSAFDSSKIHGYTFQARSGASVRVSLSGAVEQKTDTVLKVYGPKNGSSWGGLPLAKDDDSAGDKFSLLSKLILPEAGEYLLVATCKNKWFTNKSYHLLLDCLDSSCELAPPQQELGLEVDFVGQQRFEPGVVDLLKEYFASLGIQLTLVEDEQLEPLDMLEVGRGSPVFQKYYLNNFGHRGQAGWHYMLMADYLDGGYQGWGMLGGDVFAISSAPVDSHPSGRKEAQANIILHELGHNLGLTHEGFEPEVSAGTHNGESCATAAFPADNPVTFYSPSCIAHINLNSIPMVEP